MTTVAQIEQLVRARLGERGLRYTRGRRQVAVALIRAGGPRSPVELHREIRAALPLSSLYRSLAILTGAGVLSPHHGPGGRTRFEMAEWLIGHHHHLVCVDCGAVDDISLSAEVETLIEEAADRIAGAGGYALTGHTLEVEGRCRTCAPAAADGAPANATGPPDGTRRRRPPPQ